MMGWLWWASGVVTPLALWGLVYLGLEMFTPTTASLGCSVCGYVTDHRIPAARWLAWKWHNITIRPRSWHRRALAVWRVEFGYDPRTGKREAVG